MRSRYLEYKYVVDHQVVSYGISLFVQSKHFLFEDPNINVAVSETEIQFIVTLTADAFAKGVQVDLKNADCTFSDNWFDVHRKEPITITIDKDSLSKPLSLSELKEELTVDSNFNL